MGIFCRSDGRFLYVGCAFFVGRMGTFCRGPSTAATCLARALQKMPIQITYEKCPSDLRKLPIWPTKNAHPPYEKCPSDLRKMHIWPTKSVHPTYEKCPSDLRKMNIRPITKSAHPTYKKGPSDLIQSVPYHIRLSPISNQWAGFKSLRRSVEIMLTFFWLGFMLWILFTSFTCYICWY